DGQAGAPAGPRSAFGDGHAGRGHGRHPHVNRVGHALLAGALADGCARAVLHAVRDHRPAVVGARLDDVQFVAALRPVLDLPDDPGAWVASHALRVAVAEGEKLRPGAVAVDKGVVVGHAAVAPEADHAGVMGAEVLAVGHIAAVAEGQVHVPGVEHDAAT